MWASVFDRYFIPCRDLGLDLFFEDDAGCLLALKDNAPFWCIEVIDDDKVRDSMISGLKEIGRLGETVVVNDRAADTARYLLSRHPRYFTAVSPGGQQDFEVLYTQEGCFALVESALPL